VSTNWGNLTVSNDSVHIAVYASLGFSLVGRVNPQQYAARSE